MRVLAFSLLVVTGFASFTAAACEDAPMVGAIPNGATATAAQMAAARAEIATYMAATEDYLACLENELAAKGNAATAEYQELMGKRILAGKDERRRVARAFNDALQAFRAVADPAAN